VVRQHTTRYQTPNQKVTKTLSQAAADVITFTDGRLSGAADELVRNACASKYPAELKSFQLPTSSFEKKLRNASKSLLSSALPTVVVNAVTPALTRSLYRCLAESKYAPPAVAPPEACADGEIRSEAAVATAEAKALW